MGLVLFQPGTIEWFVGVASAALPPNPKLKAPLLEPLDQAGPTWRLAANEYQRRSVVVEHFDAVIASNVIARGSHELVTAYFQNVWRLLHKISIMSTITSMSTIVRGRRWLGRN